jgi:hypothetical protein
MLLPANPTPPKEKKSKKSTVQANGLVINSTLQSFEQCRSQIHVACQDKSRDVKYCDAVKIDR